MKISIQYYARQTDEEPELRSTAFSFDSALQDIGRMERAIKARDEKNALQDSGPKDF